MIDGRDEQQRARDRALTLVLRGAHWELENVVTHDLPDELLTILDDVRVELESAAHELPAGRMTHKSWGDLLLKVDSACRALRPKGHDEELLAKLDYLRDLVLIQHGDHSGPSIERPSQDGTAR